MCKEDKEEKTGCVEEDAWIQGVITTNVPKEWFWVLFDNLLKL